MRLLNNDSFIKISKTNSTDSIIVIENKMDAEIDALESIIKKLFLANGIEEVVYKKYSGNHQNKLVLSISRKLLKNNKEKLAKIRTGIQKLINQCDLYNPLIDVKVSDKNLLTIFPPLNTIEISDEMIAQYNIEENQNINLIDINTGSIVICSVKHNKSLDKNQIALNPTNREAFGKSDQVYIQKKANIKFEKIAVQKVDQVMEGFITLPENYRSWVEKHGGNQFELVNEVTGASMDIHSDKIKYLEMKEDTIKLSYFQRLVLETDLPQKISTHHYEKFKTILKKDEKEEKDEKVENKKNNSEILQKYYDNEKALTSAILKENNDSYNLKKTIKEALNKSGYPGIALYPVSRECIPKKNFAYQMIDKLLDIIIGSNKINLKCIRPYETDESSNVVRLTKSTLELLGMDETDNLIISYRHKKVKARALIVSEMESIKETNIFQTESELNACIGIPAHLRNQLGVNKINVCCSAERDKTYLFKKNLNIQFISIIATILAVKQTFSDDNRIVIILLLLLIPCAVYIIFSTVRNRISNK